jgi:hypothetical protein
LTRISEISKRNYKVVYDPELDPNPAKKSLVPLKEYVQNGEASDPRSRQVDEFIYKKTLTLVDFKVL